MVTDEETLACISRPMHDGIEGFWCNLIVEHYSMQSRSNLYINLSCHNILGFVKNTIFFSEIFTYFRTKIFIAKKVQELAHFHFVIAFISLLASSMRNFIKIDRTNSELQMPESL